MKRIPLLEEQTGKDVGTAHQFDADDVTEFKSHLHDEYKTMFKVQGNEFWVKYVIKLRDAIYNKFETNISPNEFDYLFIDLLKKLISKNKQSVVDFLSNVCMIVGCEDELPEYELFVAKQDASEQETVRKVAESFFNTSLEAMPSVEKKTFEDHYKYIYIIITHCAFPLIKLLRVWDICKEGEEFRWSPPTQWRLRACTSADPFDAFLRSRWGGELLKILNLKKEYIGWWRAPAKSPAKVCWCSPLQFCSENGQTNTNGWLPAPYDRQEPLDKNLVENDFFEKLEAADTDIHKWNLYDAAIGPILSTSYHEIDILNIMPEVDDKQHMGVGLWYISWNIAFGYQLYLSYLQNHHELKGILEKNSEKKKKLWVEEMQQTYSIISKTAKMDFSPRAIFDAVYDSEEFLLTPCVLIKLPWQPVLLQQWLCVALVEIMQFELESLELRHWPLPQELERCVCELLCFVADAKQRILLGLCLHVQQCVAFPKLSDNFPQMLMQYSIQPSLAALKFLVAKDGQRMLADLKTIAFSAERGNNTEIFKKSVYIPGEAYKIDADMNRFYAKHFWHIHNWIGKNLEEPLPYQFALENFDIKRYVTENPVIAHGLPVPLPRNADDHESQEFTTEEERLRLFFAKFNFKVEPKDRILKTLEVVKVHVFRQGLFPASDWDIFLKKTLVKGAQITNLYSENHKMTLISQLVTYSMLHDNMSGVLNGIDTRHTPLTWLVRLSGEIIEHEQRVRVGHICSQILQKCPVMEPEVDVDDQRNVEEMLETLQEAVAEKSKFTLPARSLLWLGFSKKWREEMDLTQECPKLSDGIELSISKFVYRLRRMLLKEHKENYGMWEQGCDTFPLSLECQYLLPQYVSCLVILQYEQKSKRNEKRIQRYLFFLHKLIRYYEEKFLEWLNDTDTKRNSSLPIYVFDGTKRVGNSMLLKMHLIPSIHQIMNAFVGLGIGFEGVPGFSEIFQAMKEWPVTKNSERRSFQVESMTIMAWDHMAFRHSLLLYNLCYEIWQLPHPTSDFGDSLLEKTYFACTVIQKLNVIISAQMSQFPLIVFMQEFQKFSSDEIDESIDQIRIDVISKVAQNANLIEKEKSVTEEMSKQQLEEYLITLSSIFRLMCTIRERLSDAKLLTPDFPACDSLSIKNAVALFVANKISVLSRILDLPTEKVAISKIPKKSKKKAASTDDVKADENSQDQQHEKCRKCSKTESKKGTFIACENCLTVNYPDVNYYCSVKCKDEWWIEEHMAEHLEFDLGLSDFDNQSTTSSSQAKVSIPSNL